MDNKTVEENWKVYGFVTTPTPFPANEHAKRAIETLIEKWNNRHSLILAEADSYFKNDDYEGSEHYQALAREWRTAISELKEICPK